MSTRAHEVFARYVQERRNAPLRGFQRETFPEFVRYTPVEPDYEGIVTFANLEDSRVAAAIAEQIAYFHGLGRDFEWKVYDLDRPATLGRELAQRGFVPGEREAFMFYPTATHRSRPLRPNIRLERVTSAEGVRKLVAVQERIWNHRLPWLMHSLLADLPESTVWLAYVDETPVGTGWVKFPAGSSFADLHGGSVLPAFRGRGIYSALFDARADEARDRGYGYLAVDAAPMSRPILLRQGFELVAETTPFRMRHAATVAPETGVTAAT
jgi:GNAT superfamily N-acetyltransferase